MTEYGDNQELITFYPIIPNKKTKLNKSLNITESINNKIRSDKVKTNPNFYNNNCEISNIKQGKAKSFKVIRPPQNRYIKIQKMMNNKTQDIFKKNVTEKKKYYYNNKYKNYLSIKKDKKSIYNNKTYDENIDTTKNNTVEIRSILNKLIKLKQKINKINFIKSKKEKNDFAKFNKLAYNYSKSHKKFSNNSQNIKYKNNKKNNYERSNDDNKKEIKNYKTITNFKNKIQKNDLFETSSSNQKKNNYIKLTLDNKVSNFNISEKKSYYIKKENKNSMNNKIKLYNYNNIITEHTNYIDKIRDSKFIILFNKFKKSMKKNKKEEINHKRSLVFPPDIVNSIIKMKNQLIIDKYKNEYLKKMDTYKYNTQKILKAIKIHNYNNYNNNNDNRNNNIDIKKNESENNKNNMENGLSEEINNI